MASRIRRAKPSRPYRSVPSSPEGSSTQTMSSPRRLSTPRLAPTASGAASSPGSTTTRLVMDSSLTSIGEANDSPHHGSGQDASNQRRGDAPAPVAAFADGEGGACLRRGGAEQRPQRGDHVRGGLAARHPGGTVQVDGPLASQRRL